MNLGKHQEFNQNEKRGDFIALAYDIAGVLNAYGSDNAKSWFVQAAGGLELKVFTFSLSKPLSIIPYLFPAIFRSDHSAFWEQSYPSIVLTDTAEYRNPNYDCPDGFNDTVETLNLPFAIKIVEATAISALMELNQ